MVDVAVDQPPSEPSGAPSGARRRLVAVAALATVVVLVLVVAGLAWRARNGSSPAVGELLAIPAHPVGPVAAMNTAAFTGETAAPTPARWAVVRTAADDRQLVVFFDGGGCGTYRADVDETDDAVAIEIVMVFPDNGDSCFAIGGPGAIGIELARPLGTRRLEGLRPIEASGPAEVLLVPGTDLATLTWPPGSSRATTEHLQPALGTGSFVWTQRFDDVVDHDGYPASVSFEQWRGATPIDDGAAFQACHFSDGATTEPTEVGGTAATLVRCPDGALAVLWLVGADRLMVRADGGATGLDQAGLLALAGTVRYGG